MSSSVFQSPSPRKAADQSDGPIRQRTNQRADHRKHIHGEKRERPRQSVTESLENERENLTQFKLEQMYR